MNPDPVNKKTRSLFDRLSHLISPEPDSRNELLELLREACARNLIDADSLSMIEGVFQVSELCARDIMVPRAQVDAIHITDTPETLIAIAQKTGHSRFPAYEDNRDNIIGILLAKDLPRFYTDKDFDVRDMLRPAVFIPESKRLNVLLRDFRINRNHIAIVVDEYGGVAGIVTIEDVLEQIVGDIEDEFDIDDEADNIIATADGAHRVRARTELAQFNATFNTTYSDDDADTLGGLLANHLGRMPRRGERIVLPPMVFEVLSTDARQTHMLLVKQATSAQLQSASDNDDKRDEDS